MKNKILLFLLNKYRSPVFSSSVVNIRISIPVNPYLLSTIVSYGIGRISLKNLMKRAHELFILYVIIIVYMNVSYIL